MSESQPIQEATVRGRSITGGYPAEERYTVEDVKFAHKLALAMLADRRVKTSVRPGVTKNGNPFFVLAVEDEPGAQDFAKIVGAMVTRALRIASEEDAASGRELYTLAIENILLVSDARLAGAYGLAPEGETLGDADFDAMLRRWLGVATTLRPWLESKVDHVPLRSQAARSKEAA